MCQINVGCFFAYCIYAGSFCSSCVDFVQTRIMVDKVDPDCKEEYGSESDFEDAIGVVMANPLAFAKLPLRWRDHPQIALTAVSELGCALQYASSRLRADFLVCLTAVTMDVDAMGYVDLELQCNRDFLLQAMRQNRLVLWRFPEVLRHFAIGNTIDGKRAIVATANDGVARNPFAVSGTPSPTMVINVTLLIHRSDGDITYEVVQGFAGVTVCGVINGASTLAAFGCRVRPSVAYIFLVLPDAQEPVSPWDSHILLRDAMLQSNQIVNSKKRSCPPSLPRNVRSRTCDDGAFIMGSNA